MKIGMLTAPMRDVGIQELVDFATRAGIQAFEVAAAGKTAHFDPDDVSVGKQLVEACEQAGLEISSLAAYVDVTAGDEQQRRDNQELLARLVDMCAELGVEVLCCNAGQPPAGMSREEAIEQLAAPFYRELAKKAADKGIKLALENWTATNMMNLAQWELMFELVPDENFGLNFDPSHLVWQDIDYLNAVDVFGQRIFHTHAKDTEIIWSKKAWLGNQVRGWWRFVIPGLGEVKWGQYIARLRKVGFNGVLSIEHEDSAVGREEGFMMAARYLGQFVAG